MEASGNIDVIAKALLEALRATKTIPRFSGPLTIENLEAGYNIQRAVSRQRREPIAGYKIGMAHEKIWRKAGLTEPIYGTIHKNDVLPSGAKINVGTHLQIIESEIIFKICKDVDPLSGPFTAETVFHHVSKAFAGIEVCNSRYQTGGEKTIPALVADNSNLDRIIMGDAFDVPQKNLLDDFPVTLTISENSKIVGSTAKVCGNPFEALAHLENWLSLWGVGLKKGQIVATGSCTGLTKVDTNTLVSARFGALGKVSLTLARN